MNGENEQVQGGAAEGRRFIGVTAVAKRWDVSESTVRRRLEEGYLRALKVGRLYKILLSSVHEYEKNNMNC
ncbi:MAG: excisionase family DNA-binding protein [Nitrospinota bacterium]|nr:excisionase family DNA-binding protein [Nitrospinota bacterium]